MPPTAGGKLIAQPPQNPFRVVQHRLLIAAQAARVNLRIATALFPGCLRGRLGGSAEGRLDVTGRGSLPTSPMTGSTPCSR
jgi:hypothetical protein